MLSYAPHIHTNTLTLTLHENRRMAIMWVGNNSEYSIIFFTSSSSCFGHGTESEAQLNQKGEMGVRPLFKFSSKLHQFEMNVFFFVSFVLKRWLASKQVGKRWLPKSYQDPYGFDQLKFILISLNHFPRDNTSHVSMVGVVVVVVSFLASLSRFFSLRSFIYYIRTGKKFVMSNGSAFIRICAVSHGTYSSSNGVVFVFRLNCSCLKLKYHREPFVNLQALTQIKGEAAEKKREKNACYHFFGCLSTLPSIWRSDMVPFSLFIQKPSNTFTPLYIVRLAHKALALSLSLWYHPISQRCSIVQKLSWYFKIHAITLLPAEWNWWTRTKHTKNALFLLKRYPEGETIHFQTHRKQRKKC